MTSTQPNQPKQINDAATTRGTGATRLVAVQPAQSSFGLPLGFSTLFYKEMLRFWKVALQTVFAPILTALLYLVIFGHVLEDRVQVYPGVRYTAFLVPGLVMMSLLQNAFANASSSMVQSKISGNMVFVLLAPLSHLELFSAYVLAAMARGLIVGLGVFLATVLFTHVNLVAPLWIIVFGLFSAAILGTLGLIVGIQVEKFDHLAAWQTLLIVPATFLSGVFYSIHSLPPLWQWVSHFNPFFYMIDGFRYGFVGHADVDIWRSLAVVSAFLVALVILALRMLSSGYKLRR
jgi:ABC-2 type transport system permease protein